MDALAWILDAPVYQNIQERLGVVLVYFGIALVFVGCFLVYRRFDPDPFIEDVSFWWAAGMLWPVSLVVIACAVIYDLLMFFYRGVVEHIHPPNLRTLTLRIIDGIVLYLTMRPIEKTDKGELWRGKRPQYREPNDWRRRNDHVELRVRDTTTGRPYRIPVHPTCETVDQALVWSFSNPPQGYAPTIET